MWEVYKCTSTDQMRKRRSLKTELPMVVLYTMATADNFQSDQSDDWILFIHCFLALVNPSSLASTCNIVFERDFFQPKSMWYRTEIQSKVERLLYGNGIVQAAWNYIFEQWHILAYFIQVSWTNEHHPFHSWEWPKSNLPSSPTRNITSHCMKNLAYSDERWL